MELVSAIKDLLIAGQPYPGSHFCCGFDGELRFDT
jgi:hypothetical protein